MAKKPKTDGGTEQGAEGSASGAKGGNRKTIIIAGVAVALLAMGVGGYFMFAGPKGDAVAEVRKPVAFVDIREMTINLAPEPNEERPRLLRFRVALEVRDAEITREIQPLLPRVEDTFQVFVRELRASDLEGSSGVYRLREELLRRVNVAVYPAKVDAVLFKDIVVQ